MRFSSPDGITRRSATRLLAGTLLSTLGSRHLAHALSLAQQNVYPSASPTESDIAFLEDMQRSACLYFTEQVDPASGQVLDRAINKASTGTRDSRFISSIAATGFGLTALCIADKRRYTPAGHAKRQVLATLRSRLATQIYDRVEWPWMLNTGKTFSKGWRPDFGFVYSRWDHYSELMMLYLLAIGSTQHPIPPDHWNNFTRPRVEFGPYTYISGHDPLFVHQYSHAWFDFAHKRDAYSDYFANSITATRAHKAFCLSQKRGYTDDYWGITASDWQHGYTAWGGPPLLGPVDGSVVPAATAGSLPFLPAECLRVLRYLKDTYSNDAWGRYGFCDAFHPDQLWYDPDVLGIDLGIGLLMAENLRTGFVWNTFMKNPEPATAMKMCGFRNT